MGDKWESVFSLSSANWRRGGAFRSDRNKPLSPCPLPAALRREREKGSKSFGHVWLNSTVVHPNPPPGGERNRPRITKLAPGGRPRFRLGLLLDPRN